ncbi:MAG TPA: hypothetical protein VIG47_12995 [Gemmatimonadaceae bacterium]|jgi:hypothetical protein
MAGDGTLVSCDYFSLPLMKIPERAWQAWPLLAFAAGNRQIITYEILGKLTGMHAAGLGDVLEQVQSYCLVNNLPPLTALVVNKGTGLPSPGFVAATDVPRAFIKVFEHDWLATPCPSPEQLAEATRVRPSNGVAAANAGQP